MTFNHTWHHSDIKNGCHSHRHKSKYIGKSKYWSLQSILAIQKLTKIAQNWQKLTKIDKNWQKSTKISSKSTKINFEQFLVNQNRQELIFVDFDQLFNHNLNYYSFFACTFSNYNSFQNWQELTKIDKNCQKLTKIDKNWLKSIQNWWKLTKIDENQFHSRNIAKIDCKDQYLPHISSETCRKVSNFSLIWNT